MEIDHYEVLGLPSGEKGARLSQADIRKAYLRKALELHPDKRPGDPNACSDSQKLNASYDVLKNEVTRKLFDQRFRVPRASEYRRKTNNFRREYQEQETEQQQWRKWRSYCKEREEQQHWRKWRSYFEEREEVRRSRKWHAFPYVRGLVR